MNLLALACYACVLFYALGFSAPPSLLYLSALLYLSVFPPYMRYYSR